MLRGTRRGGGGEAACRGVCGPRSERGQAQAELAIFLFVILVMALTVFDVGRAFHTQLIVTQLARDGARVAVDCTKTAEDVRASVLTAAGGLSPTVTVSPDPRSCPADPTRVTVSVLYQWLTPLGNILGSGGSVTLSSTMTSQ